ncbi:MAG: sigma-70 family RNA polymerase sigma factor, partial [Acidobacteriaceae bacterium]|nr:sigma-70 family RNA polymerase sigma factor [Acidobacteriaceae bacterium]
MGASIGLRRVESSAAMAKAAATRAARNSGRLTQAQMDARAQQRAEDDDLIRAAQKGDRASFDQLVRR